MPRRVLVTRPQPGAAATARRLQAAGYEPVILPLTEIVPITVASDAIAQARRGFAVAATSANAFRHAGPSTLAALTDKPCLAVGSSTARAARDAGFANVQPSGGDAEELAMLVVDRTPAGAVIVYLCGRTRRPGFEKAVSASGRDVLPIETYDAAETRHPESRVLDMLDHRRVDAVLLYSERAAALFARLKAGAAGRYLDGARLIGLSRDVGAPLSEAGYFAAAAPTEDALFEVLSAVVPPAP